MTYKYVLCLEFYPSFPLNYNVIERKKRRFDWKFECSRLKGYLAGVRYKRCNTPSLLEKELIAV